MDDYYSYLPAVVEQCKYKSVVAPVCSTKIHVCIFCRVTPTSIPRKNILEEISAVGCTGVWRLLHGDLTSAKQDIIKRMSEEEWITQPEMENFMLTELTIGYLA